MVNKFSKLTLYLIFSFFIVVASCTRQESKGNRLNSFYKLIDNPGILDSFKQGDILQVFLFIDEKNMSEDENFKLKYVEIKAYEGIDYFTTEQFVLFFYENFYLKLLAKE